MSEMSERMASLVRALNLIPYFRAHPDNSLFEAARDLGLNHRQMVADLQRLHTSGVGMYTEELIDLTFNANRTEVTITEDQGLTAPLRLTTTEAGALLLMLESLEEQLVDTSAVRSAAQKIRTLVRGRAGGIAEAEPEDEDPDLLVVNEALRRGQRLRFRYHNVSRNEWQTRIVDPATLYLHEGHTYLAAWDDSRKAHRKFRLDRIHDAELLDDTAHPHLQKLPKAPFRFDQEAEIELRESAAWLAEYHDITLQGEAEGGWIPATLPFGSSDWLVRFAVHHGDRLRLVSPADVALKVRRRAQDALAAYRDHDR